MTRPLAGFALLLVVTKLSAADATLPRYEFEPGQELAYRTTSTLRHMEDKAPVERGSQADWTVWVVRRNDDGGFRLVIQKKDASSITINGKKQTRSGGTRLVYADVFPDGRILPNDTLSHHTHPGVIFPRLPSDAKEAATGWSWEWHEGKVTARPVKSDKGFRFATVTASPMHDVYLSTSKSTYTFDRGHIAAAESVGSQGYPFDRKEVGAIELLGVKAQDAALARHLAAEERGCFEAVTAYDRAFNLAVERGQQGARKQLKEAIAALEALKLTHPLLKAEQERRVGGHAEIVKHRDGWRAKVTGRRIEPFETTDIDGKPFKLADHKGKVVVLDFWLRNCPNCIKAMPQINGLAEDFAGKPVAIFGMNVGDKDEDARLVIAKMGLKYPTLKAGGLTKQFGDIGLPTLIVIDREGKVHDLHAGYTPTLREDVGRQIKELLEKK